MLELLRFSAGRRLVTHPLRGRVEFGAVARGWVAERRLAAHPLHGHDDLGTSAVWVGRGRRPAAACAHTRTGPQGKSEDSQSPMGRPWSLHHLHGFPPCHRTSSCVRCSSRGANGKLTSRPPEASRCTSRAESVLTLGCSLNLTWFVGGCTGRTRRLNFRECCQKSADPVTQ